MFKAHQVMTKNVVTVNPDTEIIKAAKLLAEHKISGLPVVDREGKLHGILSEKDLLKLLSEEKMGGYAYDYMTKEVISFKETDSIIDICDFLKGSYIRRVPIVDDEMKLVGVISRADIIIQILKMRGVGVAKS